MVTTPEPRTYKLAMDGEHSDCWREATTQEYNTLVENGTWEIVDLPEGEKAIGSGWVFRVKHHDIRITKVILRKRVDQSWV